MEAHLGRQLLPSALLASLFEMCLMREINQACRPLLYLNPPVLYLNPPVLYLRKQFSFLKCQTSKILGEMQFYLSWDNLG